MIKTDFSWLNDVDAAMSVVDLAAPDQPLIFINPAFSMLTGYAPQDVVGKNCRFLQGRDTNQRSLDLVRRAIAERRSASVCLLNLTKSGEPFHNLLLLKTLRSPFGADLCIGSQYRLQGEMKSDVLRNHLQFVQDAADLINGRDPVSHPARVEMLRNQTDAVQLCVNAYLNLSAGKRRRTAMGMVGAEAIPPA